MSDWKCVTCSPPPVGRVIEIRFSNGSTERRLLSDESQYGTHWRHVTYWRRVTDNATHPTVNVRS